jgi:hypothetical protein
LSAVDFSIGDAAGDAAAAGDGVGLVLAGAANGAQTTSVAMPRPMTNDLFVFIFLSLG